ncbi:MAG: CDP-alcohol phosphatidyltransferase family protein [Planctomycetes bacterium]|nr:CDP-alcohol phosphatidyltransferase family protein [Planctomycetota bacterium]
MTVLPSVSDSQHLRPRRRRLKSLAFLPTLITLGNLTCGFAAVHFAMRGMYDFGAGVSASASQTLHSALIERMLPSFLSVGAGLVIAGMIFDCFDGLIARATRSTTNFGGQLDSLADIVTCGVAPATLMVAYMTTQLARDAIEPSPLSEHFLGRATWVAAAMYVAFAAIRLARFNVEHAEADYDYRVFRGLPSPGAACIVATLIICTDQIGEVGRRVVTYALPVVAVCAALLMVSRIPYKRFYRAYLLGRQPFGQFLVIMLVLALFLMWKAPTLLLVVLWYGVSGPVFYLGRLLRGRHAAPDAPRVTAAPAGEARRHA